MKGARGLRVIIDGALFVRPGDARREVGMPTVTTVTRWMDAGAVECIVRNGLRLVRLDDVRAVRELTSAETRQLGVSRVPEHCKEYTRRWLARAQDRTRPFADRHREQWDDIEVDLVASCDGDLQELALRLGRTYAAVTDARWKFRS